MIQEKKMQGLFIVLFITLLSLLLVILLVHPASGVVKASPGEIEKKAKCAYPRFVLEVAVRTGHSTKLV